MWTITNAMDINALLTASLTLFAVIDIVGSIPLLIDIKKTQGHIHSMQVTLYSGLLMYLFLFTGDKLLTLLGIDIPSFAIAGSIVIFIIGLEMILGHRLFKEEKHIMSSAIVPIAFPLIAGAGTITAILSLKAEFSNQVLSLAIGLNLLIVFLVLKMIPFIEGKIKEAGLSVLRRIFGVILLAISVKIFTTNLGNLIMLWQ